MNRDGKLPWIEGDDQCIVCRLDFESHRWIRPASKPKGHDYTPLHGPPVPYPRSTRASEAQR